MKRIEDIKVVRKKKAPASPAPDWNLPAKEQDYQPEVIEENQQKSQQPLEARGILGRRPKIKNLWLKIILAIFIIALITLFWGFSLSRAKAKITAQTSGLNKDFSAFLEAISNKDIFSLAIYINNFNQKSEDSLLILQSAGQDIYVFSLLYPKGQSSQMTDLIDTLRAGHLLTSSYARLADTKNIIATTSSNDWLGKINQFLDQIRQYNLSLPGKIFYAKISSREATAILANTSGSNFTNEEKKTAENLEKLSEVSTTFFDYLSKLPDDLNQNLTFSGGKKSYLILFLNNAEIRPGGGFLGSFARLDLENGEVTAIDFEKNIYTLDKAFLAAGNNITPPKELQSLTKGWTMRDSNMSADFAQSSQKVAWFYQEESGNEVDGVITLDTTLFRNLLNIIGAIEMPEYKMTISADNFLADVQYQVEIGYYQNQENWAENQPKKILADMMPKFIEKITTAGVKQKAINQAILSAIQQKHFLLYFNSSRLEDLVTGIGASGKISETNGDYLYLSDANLGGYKSSLNIAESVKQKVEIDENGNVSEKLMIIRKHNGTNAWPDGINNNFIKVFLPLSAEILGVDFISGDNNPRSESTLVEKKKFTTGVEASKSFISFWQNTKPGEESQSIVSYKRDKAMQLSGGSFDFLITIQKQPGIETFDWQLDFVYPEGWKPENIDGYDAENRRIILKETIRQDSVFRLRFIRSQKE